jgi:hypothetical protein
VHWGCYATTLDIEVDPQRRRFGCESDFALQRLVECHALDGTREEPGTSTQGDALISLAPLVWESNPKLQGGWCKTQPPAHRGI